MRKDFFTGPLKNGKCVLFAGFWRDKVAENFRNLNMLLKKLEYYIFSPTESESDGQNVP